MTKKPYHKYVFDVDQRKLVGNFEEMYSKENAEEFDSWHERDLRLLRKQIPLSVISQYNFSSILELGCGKGTFTHLIKKKNNTVLAVDISKTAIKKAKASYPDVNFVCGDITDFVSDLPKEQQFDLGLVMGTFAYINHWEVLLKKMADHVDKALICEFIPDNPIGFVKSIDSIVLEFSKYFQIETKIILDDHHVLLFGEKVR